MYGYDSYGPIPASPAPAGGVLRELSEQHAVGAPAGARHPLPMLAGGPDRGPIDVTQLAVEARALRAATLSRMLTAAGRGALTAIRAQGRSRRQQSAGSVFFVTCHPAAGS